MMKIKNAPLLFVLIFFLNTAYSQTIVKMDLPPQADSALSVVTLFDEEIPNGIPVVLGLMGFDVEGGITPYQCAWLLNGDVISNEDFVVFTPQSGDNMVMQVTDQNQCRASVALNLVTGEIPRYQEEGEEHIEVYPTVFTEELFIRYPETIHQFAHVRVFNLGGTMVFEKQQQKSGRLQLNLAPGTYLVSVKIGELHKVEKITAQ